MEDSNSTPTKGCEGGGESSPVDMEKLRQKLQRAYLRRDHYAQLYYQTKSELEETKWQLNVALNKIKQMQTHAPKYKSNSLEYPPRNDHRVSPPDRNGRISPDSGAISMSPGVESTEGHGQLEDETTDDTASSASDPTGNHRISKNNYKMNGINESLTGSGDIKPNKRVVFRDVHPPMQQSTNLGSNHGSYEKMNISSQHQPVLQRSYTFEHGEFNNHFMSDVNGAGISGIKMQRTSSYNQGTRPPQGQFSTFPGSYSIPHPQQMFNGSYSMQQPEQHRLPRVHRGYESSMLPPPQAGMVSPPYHQPPPPPRIIQQQQQQNQQQQNQQHQSSVPLPPRPPGINPHHSAFQRVPMKQGGGGSIRAVHQYENVMVYPSYYSPPTHIPYPPYPVQQPPHQQPEHQEKQLHGERWTYSGLTQEEFSQLLSQLSLPNTKVERLEISRSNLGNIPLMNQLCKELKKNSSLVELSLPNNEIDQEALKILLATIAVCKNIKDLKLPGNDIGEECLDVLKQFLENCSLRSLILSGNEIEHHTHLLDALLPQDLQYEGVPGNRSLPVSPDQVANNMKLLQI